MANQKRNKAVQYFWNILIAFDQFCNTVLLGDPDETMSSRFGKWLSLPHVTWKWKVSFCICSVLNRFETQHCIRSIETDEGKTDLLK